MWRVDLSIENYTRTSTRLYLALSNFKSQTQFHNTHSSSEPSQTLITRRRDSFSVFLISPSSSFSSFLQFLISLLSHSQVSTQRYNYYMDVTHHGSRRSKLDCRNTMKNSTTKFPLQIVILNCCNEGWEKIENVLLHLLPLSEYLLLLLYH